MQNRTGIKYESAKPPYQLPAGRIRQSNSNYYQPRQKPTSDKQQETKGHGPPTSWNRRNLGRHTADDKEMTRMVVRKERMAFRPYLSERNGRMDTTSQYKATMKNNFLAGDEG